ncbi:MAG: sirohydrochlorin chelatase [Leptolyngbya sp. SIO1D8]|nr:sirohydrochlorin chelatase [Leptolyngbya sp. SIO1D8]
MMRQQLEQLRFESVQMSSLSQQTVNSLSPVSAYLNQPTQGSPLDESPFRPIPVPYRLTLPPFPVVGTATLEATNIPLAQQIAGFAKRVMGQGIYRVVVVPLFLLEGVHVREDLPQEIVTAQSLLPEAMQLVCTPHLGGYPSFKDFVISRLAATTADRCLLLAHGSRRSAGNRGVQKLGNLLDADVAFWAVPPDLETQIIELMQQGYQHIAIAPYFLFPGGITDAITRRTEDLAERLPKLSLRLLTPLGMSANLGKVVAELALNVTHSVSTQSWGRDRWQMARNEITA